MSETKQTIEGLADAIRKLWIDLPEAALRWGFGMSTQDDFAAVAWKSYDAALKVATELVDDMFKNPLFNEVVSNASLLTLRAQSVADRLAGGGARRELQSLRGQLAALSEEVDELRNEVLVRPRRRVAIAPRQTERKVSAAKPQLAAA